MRFRYITKHVHEKCNKQIANCSKEFLIVSCRHIFIQIQVIDAACQHSVNIFLHNLKSNQIIFPILFEL